MYRRREYLGALGAVGVPGLAGCAGRLTGVGTSDSVVGVDGNDAGRQVDGSTLSLTSNAFAPGTDIPARYSCEGENESPPLTVSGLPDAAAAWTLVVDDPDAPTETPFVHWVLWDVPPTVTSLSTGVPSEKRVLDGAVQGTNDTGSLGYVGPCPPRGDRPHTYRFALFATDATLGLPPGTERAAVDDALEDVTVARTTLTGTFQRP